MTEVVIPKGIPETEKKPIICGKNGYCFYNYNVCLCGKEVPRNTE